MFFKNKFTQKSRTQLGAAFNYYFSFQQHFKLPAVSVNSCNNTNQLIRSSFAWEKQY